MTLASPAAAGIQETSATSILMVRLEARARILRRLAGHCAAVQEEAAHLIKNIKNDKQK